MRRRSPWADAGSSGGVVLLFFLLAPAGLVDRILVSGRTDM